jgi:hypothetical protein
MEYVLYWVVWQEFVLKTSLAATSYQPSLAKCRHLFFVINLLGVSSLVFLMVSYFVGQKNMFQEKLVTVTWWLPAYRVVVPTMPRHWYVWPWKGEGWGGPARG